MPAKQLWIYCDGGFGNRYNALLSGLATANLLDLDPLVYWPCNNWCRAPFDSLFAVKIPHLDRSITQLKGQIDHLTPLLHDEPGAQVLGVDFNSVYAYTSAEDVRIRALMRSDGLFYSSALIPDWLPTDALATTAKNLVFHAYLTTSVSEFIANSLGRPYYGIHLRRTDLEIGLSDAEVKMLVQTRPDDLFFVCSDDPLSERIAAAHENVRIRSKSAHVSKKSGQGNWNDLTLDEDQRAYFSNIERGAAAVQEAVIDLLVLAHSTIVGFSGSTFQSVARLIGQIAPLQHLDRLPELDFPALGDHLRRLKMQYMSLLEVMNLSENLLAQGRQDDSIRLLQTALNHYSGTDAFPILFNLAVALFNAGRYGESEVFIDQAIFLNQAYLDIYIVAAEICRANRNKEKAINYLNKGQALAMQSGAK